MTKAKKKQTATTNSYSSQYKNPKWQKKRLEILERDNFACRKCGDKESTLHVHHTLYKHGSKIWEYDEWSLLTLCEECHSTAHVARKAISRSISSLEFLGCLSDAGDSLPLLFDILETLSTLDPPLLNMVLKNFKSTMNLMETGMICGFGTEEG